MIAFIDGELVYKEPGSAVLDVGGIGYRVSIPDSTYHRLPAPGNRVKLHTRLIMKDEELNLYGFTSAEELSIFLKILNVSGVGPRGAMALLSNFAPETLRGAVAGENASLLAKAPGIGKKTAQRIILELKDRLEPVAGTDTGEQTETTGQEALSALVSLGYTRDEAKSAVSRAVEQKGSDVDLQDLIRYSLKVLGK